MILESSYWKEPLLEAANWLRRVRLGENLREKTIVKIEKEIFMGFYSVRKLLETLKVSDSTKVARYDLVWHKNLVQVDWLNYHNVEELYELEKTHLELRDIGFVCNLFIHSYVFSIAGEDRIDGVFVSSDRLKNDKIYFVSLDVILSIFRLVGRDYPEQVSFFRDPDTGELSGYAS